jgi:hypothetical protein
LTPLSFIIFITLVADITTPPNQRTQFTRRHHKTTTLS